MITDGSRPHGQSRSGAAGSSEQGQDHLSIKVLQVNGTFHLTYAQNPAFCEGVG